MTAARARWGVAATFLVQGLLFISLTTRLPRLKSTFDLSELTISGLMLVVVLAAGAGSAAAEAMVHRWSSALALRAGLILLGLGIAGVSLAGSVTVLAICLGGYGLGVGMVDAATNMQGVAVEHALGRTVMPSMFGAWTLGGIIATIIAIPAANLSLTTGLLWLAAAPVLALAAPLLKRTGSDPAARSATQPQDDAAADPILSDPAPTNPVPWRRIMLVGLVLILFYMVDTAATTWGPLYLHTTLASPESLSALATLPYLVTSLIGRFTGDGLVERLGAVRVVRIATVASVLALAVVTFAPNWPIAVVGFLILGGAIATIAPLSFTAAATIAGEDGPSDPAERHRRTDAVIARFNQFNYVGALLGAVMTGVVGNDDLRFGFALPMLLVLGILPLAHVFGARRERNVGGWTG